MVDDCLDSYPEEEMFKTGPRFPVATSDLAVAVEKKGRSLALFLSRDGYLTCDQVKQKGEETSGGFGVAQWADDRQWLPGPMQVMGLMSSEIKSGWVMAGGRVSYRVERVVLDHGNGATTRARLANGAFGLTTTDDVAPDAELVAYDAAGEVIERDPLFQSLSGPGHCYTDPDGRVVFHREVATSDSDCLPAEPWRR